MCLQLLLTLALLSGQETAAGSEPQVRFGQLRHVQLLEPRGKIVRFATQIELGTRPGPWAEGQDTCIAIFEGDSTRPVEELAVGASLIGDFTWLVQPAWFLMELGKSRRLVALERKLQTRSTRAVGGELRVLSFPGGEEVKRVGGVQEIEDALVHSGLSELDVREYGQSLAFVPDTDEDGVPDLLVTGPWSLFDDRVDLLSGHTGGLLKYWSPEPYAETGHPLSLSGDSRQVLVGGTEHRGYPENLAHEGRAHLLEVPRMEILQTWKLPCRDR